MKFLKYALVVALFHGSSARACSAFCLAQKGRVLVGKSYDWFFFHGHGMVYVTPRGVARATMIFDDQPLPARWTTKYGSVMLTQFGRATPVSGMNEAGLVVEMLQSPTAAYNSDEKQKPYVNESSWSQYQLDNYATVAEVVRHVESLRIEKAFTEIHYFVADATGDVATVDYVDGRAVVKTGADLPTPVLTNDTYADSLATAGLMTGAILRRPVSRSSAARFRCARELVSRVSRTEAGALDQLAWDTLEAVRLDGSAYDALGEPSQWNLVHDVTARKISFRSRESRVLKTIDLARLDFAPGAPELMADMNEDPAGDFNARLQLYSAARNAALVRKNTWLFRLAGQGSKVQTAVDFGRR